MSSWVDYKKLRETLDFVPVLLHYNVQYKRKGSQAQAFCPLPGHQGSRKSPSFSVSFEKRIFQCFGCGRKGNILEFIVYMEGLNPGSPPEFRKGAVIADELFMSGAPRASTSQPRQSFPPKPIPPAPVHASNQASNAQPTRLVNAPLDFELKNLDTKPQYLFDRGFSQATIDHFGLGYCSKGYFAGRIAIPLHDAKGQLIGYSGRIIFDEAVDEENPKYLFPAPRQRNGKTLEFAKSLFLYNGHRIHAPVHDLHVVEGFPSVWWLWQCGFSNVVGLMGSSCSVDQGKIIVNTVHKNGRVWFLTDGDEAGIRCAHLLFEEVGAKRFCCWVRLSEVQPTDCSPEELGAMLEWKVSAN